MIVTTRLWFDLDSPGPVSGVIYPANKIKIAINKKLRDENLYLLKKVPFVGFPFVSKENMKLPSIDLSDVIGITQSFYIQNGKILFFNIEILGNKTMVIPDVGLSGMGEIKMGEVINFLPIALYLREESMPVEVNLLDPKMFEI